MSGCSFYRRSREGIELRVKVHPSAGGNRFAGARGGELIVKIGAPPERGRANRELIGWLAKWAGLPKRDVRILRGEHSRHKVVLLPAAALPAIREMGKGPDAINSPGR